MSIGRCQLDDVDWMMSIGRCQLDDADRMMLIGYEGFGERSIVRGGGAELSLYPKERIHSYSREFSDTYAVGTDGRVGPDIQVVAGVFALWGVPAVE
eukprot:9215319-Pyramimonas_sp.AAC.2